MEKSEQRVSFFNRLASSWDKESPAPTANRLDSIVNLVKHSNDNVSIIDVGCGTGVLIPSLLKIVGRNGRIIAIDPAEDMLVGLRQKYSDRRIQTKCETLEKCTVEDSSMDAIYCFSCFPHIDDKQQALINSARMLKSNGRIVIAHVSSRNEINSFHKNCSEPVRNDCLPNGQEMTILLEKAGFVVERFIDETGRYELVAKKGDWIYGK